MLQSNNSGGTNFDQELVSVNTMNNNTDGDNNYNNNGGTNFDQQLVPVGTMNNNADGDSNHNYNNNGGANFDQQLVPVDTVNNNAGTNFDQQLVPVDMMNNNTYGDNNYNINGVTNFGEEEFDSANTTEIQDGGGSGIEENPRRNKRKRYHRHTHHQIQEMEAFFKECPHPDDKQRKELSRQLGLDPLQIKFWFQNKRTQNKNHQERHENAQLRTDNERLRAENMRCREAIANSICPKCRGQLTAIGEMSYEEHHLRVENSQLHEEVGQLSLMAEKWTGNPVRNYPVISSIPRSLELGMGTAGREITVYGNGENLWRSITGPTDANKPMIIELAAEAMEELMTMAQVGEPLWMGGVNGTSLVLNFDEYTNTFGKGLGPRLNNGFRSEASKDTAMVLMNHTNIVKMLMDVNQWYMMFGGMIARARTHEVLLTGVAGNLDGSVQLMSAVFKVLSPLVPTRESYFVRYCKQHGDGLWAVVDVSIDHLFPNLELKCRKRPSGCLIQEILNGFSKVTWIEHVEVDDRGGVHYLYKHLIATGQAFGANCWVAALDRQCERLACINSPNFPSLEPDGLITITDQTKGEVLKLAERMTRDFFAGVTTSNEHMLRMNSGGAGDDISITTSRSVGDPGRPPGNVLCAATSFWVPIPPKTLFDFLRDENNRTQWDVLSSGGTVHKISQIANGRNIRNCVTVLRGLNANQNDMIIVQESSTNATASFVIYAPVDIAAIESVLKGGESDYVAVLPSGFVILPDGTGQLGGGGGSLITASFQMLVDTVPSSKLTYSSVATIENLIRTTMHRIKTLFPYHSA